jgi:hypothetical protein
MSTPLENLVQRLHARRSGKGWIAKCPTHDDHTPSLSIDERTDGRALLKCHAGCDTDAVLSVIGLTKRDLFPTTSHLHSNNGSTARIATPASTFDWQACVAALRPNDLVRLGNERWYSRAFCEWLRDKELVGLCDNAIAFPVLNQNGHVVAAHCRNKDGSWRYHPPGIKTAPLIIGELLAGDTVQVFESQWDGFAFMDVSGERYGIIITRGASNGRLVAGVIPERAKVYVWPQNDSAGEKWQRDICANTDAAVKRANIPAPHKDLNEWTLNDEASSDDLLEALVQAKPVMSKHGQPSPGDNSPNSRFLPFTLLDDYPAPLGLAAFHGLAGEIVRRIEPHTEADPVALLFQLLAAFGNLIGHDHYIVADGARHYLNLYGVLVGQSSKGRKGTSWNHIANLMERVEGEWRQDCISNGLSSGEGLIWAVRDPIEETRPIREKGRHTGEYETYIANHGEAHKRLLVIESEFANVLKVMTREGNTLSPVIRSAWDCGVPPHYAPTRARARDHHVWRSSKSLYTGRRPVNVNAWVASLPA